MQIRKPAPKTKLDNVIDELLDEMMLVHGHDDDYSKMTDNLSKLVALKETNSKKRVSPDTAAVVGGNIVVALMIIAFEQKHVITSRVLNFMARAR